jgi:hypothetical protein
MPGAGLEPASPKAAGFKPAVSDQFHHPGGAKSTFSDVRDVSHTLLAWSEWTSASACC